MSYLEVVGTTLLGNLIYVPLVLAWLASIVLASIMLTRGGGKAEKLLLAGCSLMFASQIVKPFLTGLGIWLTANPEITRVQAASTFGFLRLPELVLDVAGIVCLLFAFWFRWKASNTTK